VNLSKQDILKSHSITRGYQLVDIMRLNIVTKKYGTVNNTPTPLSRHFSHVHHDGALLKNDTLNGTFFEYFCATCCGVWRE
jgi:hypothetical protein